MQLDALLIGELFELMKVVGIAWIVAKTTVTSQVNVHVHTLCSIPRIHERVQSVYLVR